MTTTQAVTPDPCPPALASTPDLLAWAGNVLLAFGVLREGEMLWLNKPPSGSLVAVSIGTPAGRGVRYSSNYLFPIGCALHPGAVVMACANLRNLAAFRPFEDHRPSDVRRLRANTASLVAMTDEEFETWRVLVTDGMSVKDALSTARLLCATD